MTPVDDTEDELEQADVVGGLLGPEAIELGMRGYSGRLHSRPHETVSTSRSLLGLRGRAQRHWCAGLP
jgi:hypothetical protein